MNDLKVSDIMCKWYIWVAVGYVIGKNLSDTLGGLIGLAIGGLIGCYIQKNHSMDCVIYRESEKVSFQ